MAYLKEVREDVSLGYIRKRRYGPFHDGACWRHQFDISEDAKFLQNLTILQLFAYHRFG